MNLGMICRGDNSGLGTLSWEFARHLKPQKVLLVENGVFQVFPERYKDFEVTRPQFKIDYNWLNGLDVLFTIETFYDWTLVKETRARGIKTVLMTMVEMTLDPLPYIPDVLLCPSKLDYETFKDFGAEIVYLPIPLAEDRLIWKERKEVKTLIHSGSHSGMGGRKGTQLLLDALKHAQSDFKLIIYTWKQFQANDPRVEVQQVNFKNYWQLWREGDVLVYPQGANGICLPIVEAMASGLGVITTDIFPFNEYMPKELLFKPSGFRKVRMGARLREVEDPILDPKILAEKIDEVVNKNDLQEVSNYGRMYGENHSWEKLLPDYLKVL